MPKTCFSGSSSLIALSSFIFLDFHSILQCSCSFLFGVCVSFEFSYLLITQLLELYIYNSKRIHEYLILFLFGQCWLILLNFEFMIWRGIQLYESPAQVSVPDCLIGQSLLLECTFEDPNIYPKINKCL